MGGRVPLMPSMVRMFHGEHSMNTTHHHRNDQGRSRSIAIEQAKPANNTYDEDDAQLLTTASLFLCDVVGAARLQDPPCGTDRGTNQNVDSACMPTTPLCHVPFSVLAHSPTLRHRCIRA